MKRHRIHTYSALWWTSKLNLDGESLKPEPPWKPYNPFDHYVPAEEMKLGKKSLSYQFLAVDSQNIEAVQEFCKRFGLLGPSSLEPNIVDSLCLNSFHSFKGPSAWRRQGEPIPSASVEASLIERLGFGQGGYLNINEMHIQHFRDAQSSMREFIAWVDQLRLQQTEEQENDTRLLARIRLNGKVALVRPRLEWNEQEAAWNMGWNIGSLEAAMYLMLLLDLLGPGRILSCPKCNNPFLGGRAWTTFCSPTCRNTFKQRAKRERKSKKKSVKVSRKISRKSAQRS